MPSLTRQAVCWMAQGEEGGPPFACLEVALRGHGVLFSPSESVEREGTETRDFCGRLEEVCRRTTPLRPYTLRFYAPYFHKLPPCPRGASYPPPTPPLRISDAYLTFHSPPFHPLPSPRFAPMKESLKVEGRGKVDRSSRKGQKRQSRLKYPKLRDFRLRNGGDFARAESRQCRSLNEGICMADGMVDSATACAQMRSVIPVLLSLLIGTLGADEYQSPNEYPSQYLNKWVVEVPGGALHARSVARRHGYVYVGHVPGFENLFVFERRNQARLSKRGSASLTHKLSSDRRASLTRITWVEQQTSRRREKKFFIGGSELGIVERVLRGNVRDARGRDRRFNDELWDRQWKLNTIIAEQADLKVDSLSIEAMLDVDNTKRVDGIGGSLSSMEERLLALEI
ncbi:unnamed protein product [Darwinula stevensoni]|uniref:Peptidase S8 pro-domain domain-containing protein n=1 Tax=Darwinula stevensoni TaxID=69355 RepID=A0A7R9A247_9CRUS|nr:unnamed protein product [Darwinula stevensoni]CAG0889006.1 unnamed protein product [Darwinula stevensoni]